MTWRLRFLIGASVAAIASFAGCGRKAEREPASAKPSAARVDQAEAPSAAARSGAQVYQDLCALCHMADGSGVPNMQPALVNNPIVTGDPAKLEAVIRAGSAALRDREPQYATEMPPFGTLSNEEVHAVIAYVRERFGGKDVGNTP